jgi:hypothetical protein
MWVIAKINYKEVEIFKSYLKKFLGSEISFYNPSICIEKINKRKIIKHTKQLLTSYIFCYHKNFQDENTINQIRDLKGLNYFLKNYKLSQDQILSFINNCKKFENKDGYVSPSFFKHLLSNKAKFISGPFTNLFFEIIEKQKSKMKIKIGNLAVAILDNNKYLYQPV